MKVKGRVRYLEFSAPELEGKSGITTSALAFKVLKRGYNPLCERFDLLCLDIKNRVIKKVCLSKGSNQEALVYTSTLFTHALLLNCTRIIVAHNHLSGDLRPSNPDINMVKRLVKGCKLLGINLLDSIIYNKTEYFSFTDRGLLNGSGE